MQQAPIATIHADGSAAHEPATTHAEKLRHGLQPRCLETMTPGNLARHPKWLGLAKAERAGDRMVRPLQLFAQQQVSGGLVFPGGAIEALA